LKHPAVADSDRLSMRLASIIGEAHVLGQPDDLAAFSADIYQRGMLAELVIAPATVEELSAAVTLCTQNGRNVIPRGGGFSYTGGYIPVVANSVIVDMRRLNRVTEINAADMYVTVECGCSWHHLYEALKREGLRTPYFGPISGFAATVGGALSQGSFFMGSTEHGTVAEATLGLEVVLADGTRLVTGSAATPHSPSPFFRYYGPDMTGLFLGDTGALGCKARATLRVIPFPQHHRYATFAFADSASVLKALADIGRTGVAADCYAWDPFVVRRFSKEPVSIKQGLRYLSGVVGTAGSLTEGLKGAARLALAGNRVASDDVFLLHATVDASSEESAALGITQIESLAEAQGGTATTSSVPRILRGTPFSYPNKILGSEGQRWVPVHALCPHSRAAVVLQAFDDYMESVASLTTAHRIEYGLIFFAVGNNTTCIEPLFYWPDERLPSHDHLIQPAMRRSFPYHVPDPEATRVMGGIRTALADRFAALGCAHVQIGKTYKYQGTRHPAHQQLLRAIKAHLDPQGRMNPGSLGL
jgi:FAD/FMN-containing dehydrogenase